MKYLKTKCPMWWRKAEAIDQSDGDGQSLLKYYQRFNDPIGWEYITVTFTDDGYATELTQFYNGRIKHWQIQEEDY